MNPESLAGKNVLVMGLGRFGGGVGVSKWLVAQGARVTVTDAAPEKDLADSIAALHGLPITFKLGGHDTADFTGSDLVVVNPAVDKQHSEVVQAAIARGVPTTTEMNLFLQRCPARTVGITGSVGKSTTTTLIFESLRAALQPLPDARAFLGGNIGRSLLLDLPLMRPGDLVILELSSFMLDETPHIAWSPHVAVVTNIYPNHLDRHGTMAAYTAAKQNILRFQKPDDVAILNNDHDLVARWASLARGKVLRFTTRGPAERLLHMAMPGMHNQSNAAAALAVLDALAPAFPGLDRAAAVRAIEQFPGLSHRLQLVHTWQLSQPARQIRFFNDSKATTPDASLTAIHAFAPGTALFIVGGYDKHIDLSRFESALAQHARGVIGIGQTGQAILDRIRALAPAHLLHYAGTLDQAMRQAGQWCQEHPEIVAVVLSPASASWDQFQNYEKRGDRFVELSRTLL